MRLPVIRVKALVLLKKKSGGVIEEVRVTARVRVIRHLDTLIGPPTQASTCSHLYGRHHVGELPVFAVVQRMKCLLRIYLLQKGDERERKTISLKKRTCEG